MKSVTNRSGRVLCFFAWLLAFSSQPLLAQVNSWISPGSGSWDAAANWSLGAVPSSSQVVLITNYGWKAVAINSSTPVNFPGAMAVSNLMILSPTNTQNTLLMNYVGAGNPLVVGVDANSPGSLVVGTNASMVMLSSGLIVNNSLGTTNSHVGEFAVDGTFVQNDGSEVVAGFLDLTGTYNVTNGTVFIGNQFINGAFNQQGGLNLGALDLQGTNADYELFDGTVQGNVSASEGIFRQWAGTNSVTSLSIGHAGYLMNGGSLLAGDLSVIGSSGSLLSPPSPGMVQSAGTTIVTNHVFVEGGGNRHAPTSASFDMFGGSLSAGGIILEEAGSFTQTNGTVNVANDLYITDNNTLASVYTLYGGGLSASNVTVTSSWPEQSEVSQIGGTITISSTLSIFGLGTYIMTGGTVIVSNIVLSGILSSPPQLFVNGAQNFAVLNTGTVSMNGGEIMMENSHQDFGSLTIGGNSGINFAGSEAVVGFNDSHTNAWAAGSQLLVYNWGGSTNGAGANQLVFGSSSSALTSGQLAEIVFVNPTGWAAGNYPARMLSSGEVVPDQGSVTNGPVNSWISGSGNWDDATSWSLGVLPNSSQSIMITNSGWKAVAINPSTPANYPGAMTVGNLTIRGSTNTENTLLLNYFGTALPLTISNGLTLQDDAHILDFNSGLVVQSGTVIVTNSAIIQDGGFIRMTNTPVYLQDSRYEMTNGIFEAGSLSLGYPVTAHFNQYDGAVKIGDLGINSLSSGTNQNGYSLYGGTLDLPGGMYLIGGPAGFSYLQAGGTNRTPSITIEAGYGGTTPTLTLNGGLLADGGMSVIGGVLMSVSQNGGTHIVTNLLYLDGESSATDPHIVYPATYYLNGGTLSAGAIEVFANLGDAVFSESNGTVSAQSVYVHGYGYYELHNTSVTLAGGTLSCSNFVIDDGGDHFNQSGGDLIVSNLLDFGGYRYLGYPYDLYATYTFTGGTVTASNINISGIWSIGDGAAPRITNPGYFSLSHVLQIGNAVEQLGRFILVSNATIDLAGSASKLSFANSSAQAWSAGATLVISNWNGNAAGGGAEQLKFGTDQTGLTASQLNQIQFNFGTNSYPAKILNTGEIVPDQGAAVAGPVNSWINPGSGNWDDAASWSLGILPTNTQTVLITNTGWKAVAINGSTPVNYPGSMTVTNLTVQGSTNTENTLLLNYFGTAVPLTVLNGLTLQDDGRIVDFNSGLIVQSGTFMITNSQMIQDGGLVGTTNATMYLVNGVYQMTNGVFAGGTVWAGVPYPALPGQFNQYGGTAVITNLQLESGYSLYGGTLDLPNGLAMTGRASGTSYFQAGGTNRTPFVTTWDGYAGSGPSITLNGGLFAVGDVAIHSGWFGESTVTQNGGTYSISNSLALYGGATTGATPRKAAYYLNGGTLSAQSLDLDADQGDTFFTQTNGTAHAESFSAHSVGYYSSFNTYITLSGGTLSCSNFTVNDGGDRFDQSGGALIVSNLLDFGGSRMPGLLYPIYGRYTFLGGTLSASNINITGEWVIGDGTTNRISNPGYFSLAHLLQINNAVEQLGRFVLVSNATVDLAGTASKLTFANSSAETWAAGTTLTILNWNGSPSGGGAEQLKFGSSQSGLTQAQLNQIQFQIGTNSYTSKILNTGEVVPDQLALPNITTVVQGRNMILTWPAGWTLQTATNVPGPYSDILTATSPYTNDMSLDPQRFFRLRQ